MQVHVVRDSAIPVGGAKWLELNGELAFVFAAEAVTSEGAEALEGCWQAFVDRGVWRFGEPGGVRPVVEYLIAVLPAGVAAAVSSRGGRVQGLLSPDHFHPAVAVSIEQMALEVAERGWTCVATRASVP